jgi:hypothetical protein
MLWSSYRPVFDCLCLKGLWLYTTELTNILE